MIFEDALGKYNSGQLTLSQMETAMDFKSLSPVDQNIIRAKLNSGDIEGAKNQPPEAKQGMVSKVFGGLTTRMRKISDSLGGVAKFMLKGLGLAGLIYLFKKNGSTQVLLKPQKKPA